VLVGVPWGVRTEVAASVAIDPKHWRKRAEEARYLAHRMSDPLAKELMRLRSRRTMISLRREPKNGKIWPPKHKRGDPLRIARKEWRRGSACVVPTPTHPRSTDAARVRVQFVVRNKLIAITSYLRMAVEMFYTLATIGGRSTQGSARDALYSV
jgi:hypothetical protein